LQLQIEQIKWNEGIIEVVQKGGKRHTVALTETLAKLLRTLCEGRKRGPVFIYGQNECECLCCRKWNKPRKLTGRHVRCIETGEVFTSIAKAARSIDPEGDLSACHR
jgi:Phage integrase family.